MENHHDTLYGNEFINWEQCGPAEGEADEGTYTMDPANFDLGHTIEGPATDLIGATGNDTVVQPEGITPYLLLRRDESVELNITMQEPAETGNQLNNDETNPLGAGDHHDGPSYDQVQPTQSSTQCEWEEPDPMELPAAKGVDDAISPHANVRRVQPGRKAKNDIRDRISKGKKPELSVNEGTPLIKTNNLPQGRATRSSCNTKPNACTPIPEFIQGSSRSPLTGALGVAGPSSRTGTDEGLTLEKPVRRTRGCKNSVGQGYIAIWGSHEREDEAGEIPESNRGYLFGGSPLFDLWVDALESEGFPKENLKMFSKGKSCQVKKVNGEGMCGWENKDSHPERHIPLHQPDEEVIFWYHCPACGKHTNGTRKDSMERHATSCANTSDIPYSELLEDSKNNEFLHLPCTPALVKLAEKQLDERKPPAERKGLWFSDETEIYIKAVKARVTNAKQVPGKRKRKNDESSAQPSKKSKKRKGGR